MIGNAAKQLVVERPVQAQALGAWRRSQAAGQLELHAVVVLDVRRANDWFSRR